LLVVPVLLALIAGVGISPATAGLIGDDFDSSHDYTGGVSGTIWDGFMTGPATGVVADANISNTGKLTFQSSNGAWEATGTGLLLYKNVAGDFVATLQVGSANTVSYNDLGLMARVASPSSGEDYVAARYFAVSNYNSVRDTNDGNSTNYDPSGLPAAMLWLQLERSGDTFSFGFSSDGLTFSPLGIGSITRTDMNGLALQVGIWQSTFSDASGTAKFNSFSLSTPDGNGVPEPGTVCLVALGGVALAFFRKRG
jgi:regulation of enolase protein 1 (concanavalin A-like superfamily)